METEWSSVKNEYLTTRISLRTLAKRHGLNEDELRRMARRERWTELRKETSVQDADKKPAARSGQADEADTDTAEERSAALARISVKSAAFLEKRLDALTTAEDKANEVKTIMETARIIHEMCKGATGVGGEEEHNALVNAIRKAVRTHAD